MLRPIQGEGERPSTPKNKHKDKRPHAVARTFTCSTVVFLAVSPILLATQATSAFASPYLPSHQQLQTQPKTGQAFLRPLPLGMNPSLGTTLSPRQSPSKDELAASLATLKATLAQHTNKLNQAKGNLSTAKSALTTAQAKLSSTSTSAQSKKAALAAATTTLNSAKSALETANANLATLDAAMKQQTNITAEAQAALTAAQAESIAAAANLLTAQNNYEAAQANLTSATQTSQAAQSNLTTAQANLTSAYNAYTAAQQNTQTKQAAVQQAQAAYDNSSIPNPNYVAPALTVQPTTYQVPDANFMTGTPWIGDGTGAGQPQIHSGHIHFSYNYTEVYQDILIAPREIANYNLTANIYNADTNSIGYILQIPDTYGLKISFYDANDNVIHANSMSSRETHQWRDVTLQGNTDSTTPVSRVRITVTGNDDGFWSGTYGPLMQNVRMTLGWITGSTQAATTTATMPVDIGEGGEATFVAPNSGTFISSNLRYESYNNPSCGADVTPQGLGSNVIQLVADNSIYGDTCGGEVKHLVGTLTYSTAEPQFIKDATLLPAIATAQAELTTAQQEEATAYTLYSQAEDDLDTANAEESSASQSLSSASASVSAAAAALATSTQEAEDATDELADAQSDYNAESQALTAATGKVTTAKSQVTAAEAALSTATTSTQTLEVEVNNLVSDTSAAQSDVTTAEGNVSAASAEVTAAEADITSTTAQISQVEAEIASIPEPTPTPEPEPEPEEPEIVVLPSLEDLTKVNFEEIVATDLTAAQAEEIKEAALETFLTAESGSPAYEAALDALFVAAQADDIVVDESLASIPGVGAAAVAVAEVLNLLSNVGADMNPVVREEAQKATVAAVIVGQVAQAAVAATSAASSVSTRRP